MTLIVHILLNASETWTVNKVDLDRLQAFHMRCQRRILGLRWFDKIKNFTIFSRTGLPPIGNMLHNRRHSLFGHVVRMDPLSPANQALMLCRDSLNPGDRPTVAGAWARWRKGLCGLTKETLKGNK